MTDAEPRPVIPARYRTVREGLRADIGRALAMATGGAAVFAPIEYVLTLQAYAGEVGLEGKLRLVAIVATLALVLWLGLAVTLAMALTVTRVVRARVAAAGGVGAGLFELAPVTGGVRPGVPHLWGFVAAMFVGAVIAQRAGAWAIARFKEPELTAAVTAVFAVGVAIIAWPLYRALASIVEVAARALAALPPRVARLSPLGRWWPAVIAMCALVAGGLVAAWFAVPQTRSVLPVRMVISGIALTLGAGVGLASHPRPRAPRRRSVALALGTMALVLVVGTLRWWGGDLAAKYVAVTASPALDKLLGVVRLANDLDRDGFGSLFGENDCAPFDRAIHPAAKDKAGDAIDQDCNGHDLSLADLVAPPGPTKPLPVQFQRDWNILFITIDTVRYDRTTFGGYAKTKGRNTTPRLAQLVEESTSFTRAHAPSAGTMASIPAILTSKFFHSGIALDEKRPAGSPPGILPENTTLPEIMRRKNYKTGVIGSHEWWTGWGLEQGVDPADYDNTIGAKPDPRRIVADKITNHALAWISRQQGKRWFLWAHYIDPHGHYMPHPDVVDYGTSDPDKYDAELQWTDQEVGRLLDELKRFPSAENTIVIITSDHGESMGEHNVPLGTHGSALYQELIHVPLIIYIPGNKPRLVQGAVSNLDIVPTVAALCQIDVSNLQFEGRSLVPQLFYGLEDRERVVFAETNAPGKQRAAISERWKLIHYLNTNVTELFDLGADPGEKQNLAPSKPPALARMKAELDRWMSRVLYARDPLFNQAYRQMADVLLATAPQPAVPTPGATLADGHIEVLGIDVAGKPLASGSRSDVHIYFRLAKPVTAPLRFQLAVWPVDVAAPPTLHLPLTAVRSPTRATAEGSYATDRWQVGEYIRERFPVNVPADWRATGLRFALVAVDPGTNQRVTVGGPVADNDPTTLVLGTLPLGSSPAPAP